VLVNNAGTNRPQPFLDVDPETLDSMLTLNVRSMVVRAGLKLMGLKRLAFLLTLPFRRSSRPP